MAFSAGSPTPLHRLHSLQRCPDTSSVLLSARRNTAKKEKVSAQRNEDPRNATCVHRRSLLLAGLSSFPLLRLRAVEAEDLVRASDKEDITATRKQGARSVDSDQEMSSGPNPQQNLSKKVRQPGAGSNPFLPLLNEVGIIGSGVLGALYAVSLKDKEALESTAASIKSLLDEKDAAKSQLEKNFEKRMLNEQEEHKKQVRKLREGETALSSKLSSANTTIAALGRELQSEKNSAGELNIQLDQLQGRLAQAGREKKELEGKIKEKMDEIDTLQDRVSLLSFNIEDKDNTIVALNSSLANKNSECEKLNSVLEQTKVDHENACSNLERLKMEVVQIREELYLKSSKIDELNGKIKSVLAEKDDANKMMCVLQEEYDDLKIASKKKAELDSKLLSEKNTKLQQLERKLDIALNDLKDKQILVVSLTNERNSTRAMLEEESKNAKNLQDELKTAQGNLEASKLEVSNISKQLTVSTIKCEDLMSEISRIQDESAEAQKLLSSSLDDARAASKLLSDELASVNENLNRMEKELAVKAVELKSALEALGSLKKELLETHQKVEATTSEVKKERQVVDELNEKHRESEERLREQLEARKNLEACLGKTTESLDEINNKAMSLSRELESAQSLINNLEEEKVMLNKSLTEQKNAAKEALENIEDAQNLIMRLGAERENLEKRAERLEEEVASAKGEILRLRRQSNPRKNSLNENHKIANGVEATKTRVVAKRVGGRKKKGGPSSEVSQ